MARTRVRYRAERIIVVGAGLVGCVLAMHLARRGFRVTLYERNADTRRHDRSRRPSLSLSLCTRGIRSLERIGVMDRIGPLLAPALGRMIHAADGSINYQAYSIFGEAIYCVGRRELGIALLDAAEAQGVDIQFERRCVDVDAASGTITIEDPTGVRTHDTARAVFAADGSSSTVRHHLHHTGWCQYSQTVSEERYKDFRIPAATAAATGLRHDVLHGWPRPHLIVGAFPEPDGSFAGTLHMSRFGPGSDAASFNGEAPEPAANRAAVVALFEKECPELLPAAPDIAEHLAAQRPNSLATVSCRPWSAAGKVLLVGDAAHAMLPYYGQGANAGFEDCDLIGGLVDQHRLRSHEADWPRVFSAFETMRTPDIEAMSDLCREHLSVLRDRVSEHDFQRQWHLEQRLHSLLPDVFTPLYSMIAFSSMPYAEARRRDRHQAQVVHELLRDPDLEWKLDTPVPRDAVCRHVRSRLSPYSTMQERECLTHAVLR